MDNSNLFFESIFKRKLSAAGTREYLTQITNEFPYFSPAQFFLLLQSVPGSTEYQQQAAKTAMLFNNPYWLQFQLQEKQLDPAGSTDTILSDDRESLLSEKQESVSSAIAEPIVISGEMETAENYHSETEELNDETGNILNLHEPTLESQLPGNDGRDEEEKSLHPEILPLPALAATQESITVNSDQPFHEENKVTGSIIEKESDPANVSFLSPPGKEQDTITQHDSNTDNIDNPVSNVEENEDIKINITQSVYFNNENSPLVNEPETEDELVTDKEIEPLNFRLNIETADVTEEHITFEPLHTTDYFASLGIKLSAEIKPGDKLGKQLKSFTEWLKTMKKIHTDQLPQHIGTETDSSIQKLAEQSNKEDAVVTDAMADVLLRQGKTEKAIEVYKKLSLLNPSKSAYFAAKIDQLKEH